MVGTHQHHSNQPTKQFDSISLSFQCIDVMIWKKITKTATQHCVLNYTHISDRFLNHRQKNYTHIRIQRQAVVVYAMHQYNGTRGLHFVQNGDSYVHTPYTQIHAHSERARSVLAYRIYDIPVCCCVFF